MALSDDLRKRVVEAVVSGGLSRNAAAQRFDVSIASAVRWVKRYETTGEISPEDATVRNKRQSRIFERNGLARLPAHLASRGGFRAAATKSKNGD
jgi:transposase